MKKRVEETVEFLRHSGGEAPEAAVVLGSGLGAFAEALENKIVIPYGEIPNWPASTAPGHAGRLVLGSLSGKRLAVMQGRVHYYEG